MRGHLAEPQTAERSKELNAYAQETLNNRYYWIGYNDLGHGTGNFRFPTTGTIAGFDMTKASGGSLDGDSNEHCAAFFKASSEQQAYGTVDDKPCYSAYSSICEGK